MISGAFDFARRENVLSYDFKHSKEKFDVLIECTGGKFSQSALNQAIDIADSLADIIFMGVTEELVPIDTRDILEKWDYRSWQQSIVNGGL